jgi:hypothetical protein
VSPTIVYGNCKEKCKDETHFKKEPKRLVALLWNTPEAKIRLYDDKALF